MAIKKMIEELLQVNRLGWRIPDAISQQEEMLKTLMTVTVPAMMSKAYYELESAYLSEKSVDKQIINTDQIREKLTDNIYIYRGDITAIKADAIVNAANEKMLGCFVPGHDCIDNAIHLSSGVGLRYACNELMVDQGHDEPVGQAKITGGFNLPSNYVIHTVGPNIHTMPTAGEDDIAGLLAECYTSILRAVDAYEDIRSLVFCSISTGVYGVPIELASEVALRTIETYLNEADHHLDKVIIDVFSEEDYHAYKRAANKTDCGGHKKC